MASRDTFSPGRAHNHGVLQASAEWYAILHADAVSDEDRQRWHAWLLAAPEHRQAWERVMSISSKFDAMPAALNARAANNAMISVSSRSRRGAFKLLGALCVASMAGVAGVLTMRSHAVSSLLAQYRTGVGQQRQLALADGTGVWLNTGTAMNVDYSANRREIRLLSGEILIKTAPDRQAPARPFVVITEHGELRPLGTQFTVRAGDELSNVAVFEGAVEVSPKADLGIARQVIHAGHQASFSVSAVQQVGPAEALRRDWIRGILMADDMRLGEFIDELHRYHAGILSCAPEVAELRIVGAFPIQDMPAIFAALEATLPITVTQHTPWWVSIHKKTSS